MDVHVNVDDGVSGNMSTENTQRNGFDLTTLTRVPQLSEIYNEIRQNIRPWSEFFNFQNFKTIGSLQRLSSRILQNLSHFQMNYVIIGLVLVLYCLITAPLILFVLAAVWYTSYRIKLLPSPVTLFGRDWTTNQLIIGAHLVALPILYFFGMGSILFWVVGASTLVIALHAAFYNIDAIVTEEYEAFLAETETV